MRLLPVVVLMLALAGCAASQPTLYHGEIEKLQTVKIVYQPIGSNLDMRLPGSGGGAMMMGAGKGAVIIPMPSEPGADASGKYLSSYEDVIKSLDTQRRIFVAVQQAVAQVPWLAGTKIQIGPLVFSPQSQWQYLKDSGVDAVFYLVPIADLSPNGRYLGVHIYVTLWVNPHDATPYPYDVLPIGETTELQLPKVANEAYTISADADQSVALWFADDAAQLRSGIDSMVAKIGPDLVHYLDGDMPARSAKPAQTH